MSTRANEQARRSVTSLEAMTVFVHRSEHGLSDGVQYALEALPCMVASNDASALCVRFGLSQEDLDALLSECGCLTGDKAATLKAGIKRLTGETVQIFRERHFLLEYYARVKCVAFGVEPAESCAEQRAHGAHADGGGNYHAHAIRQEDAVAQLPASHGSWVPRSGCKCAALALGMYSARASRAQVTFG
ncbi:hypothetical protein Ctob_013037 [Chrysochromulina tobinii]|uniref:Uncharacterized protein n=1 Tax=Chrysochromulina tobinii TaxID=1460289 RepID=A0A0M0K4G9_9EUKA|nr:hypothetical protein Ctob_013037 [Chrysochromulina tobinii]|eukprot:KOO33720.1 hypothetical protein Ctob_013037 [Chrysochromulina sp. CCMP291]